MLVTCIVRLGLLLEKANTMTKILGHSPCDTPGYSTASINKSHTNGHI